MSTLKIEANETAFLRQTFKADGEQKEDVEGRQEGTDRLKC